VTTPRQNTRLGLLWRRLTERHQPVDITAAPHELDHLVIKVERVWSAYAASDPYWSVLTDPIYRGTLSAETIAAFYATGQADAELALRAMRRHGTELRGKTLLEFGCGLGRISCWLAPHFEHVIGVDLSPGHLEIAARQLAARGIGNFRPLRIARLGELEHLPPYDALYSRLVLQHNPPPVAHAILDRLLRRLAPGGFAVFQVPTYGQGYRYRVVEDLAQVEGASEMEMHVLPLYAIFRLARRHGCYILEAMETDDTGWSHWRSNTFVLRKSTA